MDLSKVRSTLISLTSSDIIIFGLDDSFLSYKPMPLVCVPTNIFKNTTVRGEGEVWDHASRHGATTTMAKRIKNNNKSSVIVLKVLKFG